MFRRGIETLQHRKIFEDAMKSLVILTSPLHESKAESFDQALIRQLEHARECEYLRSFNTAYELHEIWNATNALKENQVRWTFVRTSLRLMEIIEHTFKNEKTKLLGVRDREVLKTAFDFIMALTIDQYLLSTVKVVRESYCTTRKDIEAEIIDDATKYRRLCLTVDSLLDLCSMEEFCAIITSKHLNGILSALIQLTYNPFRKPVPRDSNEAFVQSSNLREANYEFDSMTYTIWDELERNRKKYQVKLEKLLNELYLPNVIQTYMLLLGSRAIPRWMYTGLTTSLTNIFLRENGIIYAIKALVRVDFECPTFGDQCSKASKLLSKIYRIAPEVKLQGIASQFKKILCKDQLGKHDYVFINAVALIIEDMMKMDRQRTEKHVIDVMLRPLMNIVSSSEEDIDDAIIQVWNLCITPSKALVEFPHIVELVYLIMFFLYVHIKTTVYYLKTPIKKLLIRFLEQANEDQLSRSISALVLHAEAPVNMIPIPAGKMLTLSSNGGIMVEDGKIFILEVQCGETLYELMQECENSKRLISHYFVHLLKQYVVFSADKNSGEERMLASLLLNEFMQDSQFLQCTLEESGNIISFIREVLNIHRPNNKENTELIRICLIYLTVIFHDVENKNEDFCCNIALLRPHVERLRHDDRDEIKIVARTLYSRMIEYYQHFEHIYPSESECQKAIDLACDSLLPVRGHALMQLIDLLKKGDEETIAKKEMILPIFEENLKDEDSFLYLRAIEGMACLALLMPNTIIPNLCDDFLGLRHPSTVEMRLKTGEVLMRTIRSISNVVIPMKDLLIDTFIKGVTDGSSEMRASSLSNLGTLCLTLKWNVEHVLNEIVECANIALNDSSVEVRRAAVLLIGSLIRGLDTTALERKVILEVCEKLKNRSFDEDQVTRSQAEIAFRNINEIINKYFFPIPTFEKKIHVLDPLF